MLLGTLESQEENCLYTWSWGTISLYHKHEIWYNGM